MVEENTTPKAKPSKEVMEISAKAKEAAKSDGKVWKDLPKEVRVEYRHAARVALKAGKVKVKAAANTAAK
jgi:hypothetical protein